MVLLLRQGTCDPFIGERISSPSRSGWSDARQLGITFDRSPDVFISLQLSPPCSRSVCLQYLLRHRDLQNVFQLAQSQRPSECAPRLPEASLSAEHAARSEQLRPSTMPEGERSPGASSCSFRSEIILKPSRPAQPMNWPRALESPVEI
jgi:hypothetical protein